MAITPVPTSRSSEVLASRQLLSQLRTDQAAILRLQQSIATGRRIQLPSEDAPAALRGIGLQKLLERKAQISVNIQTSQSYLIASDSALDNVANLLAQARGASVGVADTTSSDLQRRTAATEVERTIRELVTSGNQLFRGRYLFGGSLTSQPPFEIVGKYVRYNGNEEQLQTYSDLDRLFDTNVAGSEVFGALSTAVQGTTDLNPNLTRDTKLSDLRGGLGVKPGSVTVNDGFNKITVDLSNAATVGDVIDLLEANPPAGRTLTVSLGNDNLNVSLDIAGGGNLTLREVGSGSTVADLGLFTPAGVGTGPLIGRDLNPRMQLTTPLDNLLGAPARTTLVSTGSNNNLVIEAKRQGTAGNNLAVNFVDDGSVIAGAETVIYDASAKTLTVRIQTGASTANHVKAALNSNAGFAADYTVALDPLEPDSSGAGFVQLSSQATTAGGWGEDLDLASGLRITNGDQSYVIDLHDAKTIEDVLNALNGSSASVLAELNAAGTGINIRSRLSGADLSIGENGGTLAAQLGLRTFTRETTLNSLNHGLGVHGVDGVDFTIDRKDGGRLRIDVGSAKTVGDVLDLVNNHPDNQDPAHQVTARLAAFGNGIELVTVDNSATSPLQVTQVSLSQAAQDLGLIPKGASHSGPATEAAGGLSTLTGRDVNPQETGGVFNALVRLRESLNVSDFTEISRSLQILDDASLSSHFVRGEIGARQQGLDSIQLRLEAETIELKSSLSNEIEVDLPQAISDLLMRQAYFDASLKMVAQTQRMTLLDYL